MLAGRPCAVRIPLTLAARPSAAPRCPHLATHRSSSVTRGECPASSIATSACIIAATSPAQGHKGMRRCAARSL